MKYVLLIPGWFPSRKNFLAGDFIERHARAAARFFPVKVLFVVKDNNLPFGKFEFEQTEPAHGYETLVIYYSARSRFRWLEKAASGWLQARGLYKGFQKLVAQHGLPSLIHAHVLVKHAWFALRQARRYHLPLMTSEQWTGYLPEAKGEFETLTAFQKRTIAAVFANAVHTTTVSEYLAKQIQARYPLRSYTVVPNLVNESVFVPSADTAARKTRFIHISTLSYQKNIGEMLDACRLLVEYGADFELLIIGPAESAYTQQLHEPILSKVVRFEHEVPQAELQKLMAASDALLLYSNYETFGCVVVEANACGLPVIASDHPVFSENVEEGVTGFRVPLHDTRKLAECMQKIINKDHRFNKERIREITLRKYSMEVVGKQFAELYRRYAKP